jgi:hypothetical protein
MSNAQASYVWPILERALAAPPAQLLLRKKQFRFAALVAARQL